MASLPLSLATRYISVIEANDMDIMAVAALSLGLAAMASKLTYLLLKRMKRWCIEGPCRRPAPQRRSVVVSSGGAEVGSSAFVAGVE